MSLLVLIRYQISQMQISHTIHIEWANEIFSFSWVFVCLCVSVSLFRFFAVPPIVVAINSEYHVFIYIFLYIFGGWRLWQSSKWILNEMMTSNSFIFKHIFEIYLKVNYLLILSTIFVLRVSVTLDLLFILAHRIRSVSSAFIKSIFFY